MLVKYEPIICRACGKDFTGRRPSEEVDVLCPDCVDVINLPIINDGDIIPLEVEAEFEGGQG